ncbi:GMP synthase [glutamine-hydrolyzing] [Tritonibacter multivorans]|uniref:GMP synthase [glutamine-hydrolyzing] n=1 Tax=Tritonibacter multivorans TaxID=928856 RepID=A0A0N7LZX0_9RHOB|nr:gamma-glutamyl-gamma-aminobutyrate hydrolase family protein [Tritonibacter multivorans]MDA7421406.1 gamma-glutamyl-gamma-aminobutyrate hydrolase family protein [Tritonibacter multivorans]CUH78841.1 GMP synthase [glutamine-hydrolyzing] [Tritonibacter multivorans]SFD28753.1 GMP synthase (glutamine-hydrolysing) [Tritonibacter multivorans]
MTTILIVEGNTPDLVVKGHSGSYGFLRAFADFAPEVELRLVSPYAADLSSAQLGGVDGVIFTGAGTPFGVDAPEAAPLRAAMELVFTTGLPVWGSCNGMQLGAYVLGGTVGDCPNGREIGVAQNLQITKAGQGHPMMEGRATGFSVPCIHRHEVTSLGPDTVLMAFNAHTQIQTIACQSGTVDFWGAQYHPELSLADIGVYAAGDAFGDNDTLLRDLQTGDSDAAAAARLGTDPAQLAARTLELQNWLGHVRRKAAV